MYDNKTIIKFILVLFLIFKVSNFPVFSAKNPISLSPEVKSSIARENKKVEDIYKYEEPKRPKQPSFVWIFLRAVFAILIVIFLIYGTVYLLKVIWGKKTLLGPSAISVIDSFYLSQTKSIHIIEIAGVLYIIGASEKGMDLLKEVSDEESINKIKSLLKRETPPFKTYLAEFVKKFSDKSKEETDSHQNAPDNTLCRISKLKESIDKLKTTK